VIRGGFMRLRDRPEDPSLPWPVAKVVETRDGTDTTLASLSGSSLDRLSETARRDLLALMLSPPRSRPMGIRVSGWRQWALETFIVLAAPEEQLVGCTTENSRQLLFFGTALPGIVAADGSGLAHLAGGRSISRLDAYGREGRNEHWPTSLTTGASGVGRGSIGSAWRFPTAARGGTGGGSRDAVRA
jgi:hypothetical protein